MENSERLGRQARPRIELGTSHLPVRAEKPSATRGTFITVNGNEKVPMIINV